MVVPRQVEIAGRNKIRLNEKPAQKSENGSQSWDILFGNISVQQHPRTVRVIDLV